MTKNRILIADDALLNREMLSQMLGDQYEFVFAANGVEAVEALNGKDHIDLLLLDIHMPVMDGFKVLQIMNAQHWIEEVPVIIISSDDSAEFITKAYDLGVSDYISRPFRTIVVKRRVANTLVMYSNKKRLVQLVGQQVYEREKVNNSMINILSDVIELRNHELGNHTLNVQTIVNLLLHRLVKITDRYDLSQSDISLITSLSALHDIGKIKIPEAILNKPGKLTEDEWAMMKTHTLEGDKILENNALDQESELIRTARSICRWHHEKYDGRGYPDGLKGDDIPIAAQVVSLSDVYDALTNERCYKPAYTHEKAMEMILGGECGCFNPLLLQCLTDISDSIKEYKQFGERYDIKMESSNLAEEILVNSSMTKGNVMHHMMHNERMKKDFFMNSPNSCIRFEYDKLLHKVLFVNMDAKEESKRQISFASKESKDNIFPVEYWDILREKLLRANRETPVSMRVQLLIDGKYVPYDATMMALWPDYGPEYTCVVGYFLPLEKK